MAIARFLSPGAYDERSVAILTTAFEEALRIADIEDRRGPRAEALAARIIVIFGKGEKDPALIARRATAN